MYERCNSIPCTKNTITTSFLGSICFFHHLMALAKDRNLKDIQARINYFGGGGPSMLALDHASSLELFGYKGAAGLHANLSMLDDGESSESLRSYSSSLLPLLSDPSNSSSSGYPFVAVHSPPPHDAGTAGQWTAGGSSSLLCFDQGSERLPHAGYVSTDHEDESALWIDAIDQNYQMSYLQDQTKGGATDHHSGRLIHDQGCFDMASGFGLSSATARDKRCGEDRFGLLYSGASGTIVDRSVVQESSAQAQVLQKRPCTDGGMQLPSPKKQCAANRKSKDKSSPSKDPQSLAAKNRRERISERLKVLQDLVPNGTKVDLVTMLEKAITYVKFLQLQVKVLATDEFWPAQGGKAPELSQVKEAMDAILSSQRERTPSLKN